MNAGTNASAPPTSSSESIRNNTARAIPPPTSHGPEPARTLQRTSPRTAISVPSVTPGSAKASVLCQRAVVRKPEGKSGRNRGDGIPGELEADEHEDAGAEREE